jgi:hypothetical protein
MRQNTAPVSELFPLLSQLFVGHGGGGGSFVVLKTYVVIPGHFLINQLELKTPCVTGSPRRRLNTSATQRHIKALHTTASRIGTFGPRNIKCTWWCQFLQHIASLYHPRNGTLSYSVHDCFAERIESVIFTRLDCHLAARVVRRDKTGVE